MLQILKRWFGGWPSGSEWAEVQAWAQAAGHSFRRTRDGDGFVIEPADSQVPWRLEWGPPQRKYIGGPELRLRGELGGATELQMMLASRWLMTALEAQVFAEVTEGTETRIDGATPEEMRWLVLYPKMPGNELGDLREKFGALANLPQAAALWLAGPLAEQLATVAEWRNDQQPLLLVVQRGRLVLRTVMAEPALPTMQAALGLFGVALATARRVAQSVASGDVSNVQPSRWNTQAAASSRQPDHD